MPAAPVPDSAVPGHDHGAAGPRGQILATPVPARTVVCCQSRPRALKNATWDRVDGCGDHEAVTAAGDRR